MYSTFNLDKLKDLLKDFYNLTQIRITIFDDHFNELASYPEERPLICEYIRQNPDARECCRISDMKASKRAADLKSPYVYQCHAGLTEAVAPVYMGNILIANLWFGHLLSYDSKIMGWMNIRRACKKYEFDEADLKELVMGMNLTSEDTILSAAHILEAVASYLCIDKMITLHQQNLSLQIDEYINNHFTDDISVKTLCDHFHIGKTALYDIAKNNYGIGIAEHIRNLRINLAKKLLLEDGSLSISDIASRCGFNDYNYFITVFKKQVGISPLKFRKRGA